MNKYPVWLDCDVGVDDAIAIMALHALEETDLLAISTVSGNVPLSSTFSNAHRMNGLMKTNYPVYKGADRPLIVQPQYAYTFHGKNGLGDVELPLPEDAKMLDTPAWDALYDCAKQHPGELRLIAIGPLTNVAIALTKYPELKTLLHTILIMGGAAVGGNVTPAAEFNIYADPDAAQAAIAGMDAAFRHEYAAADPDVFVRTDPAQPQMPPMDAASTQRAVCMLCCLPNGVQTMSQDIPGLVQTSLNLGILTTDEQCVQASFCVRSSVATQKEMLVARLRCLMAQLGGSVDVSGDYPAWEFRKDSPLRERMIDVFREQYGHDPKVDAIHAGVECGLFAGKLPGLDCVSFGPDLTEIHTCRERMHIASVQRVWRYTLEVLRRCK